MNKPANLFRSARLGPVVMAMTLGTALSTLGGSPAAAEAPQTVNDLSRYCTACWRNARLPADCWPDCTQEVLVRLLERVPPQEWGRTLQAEGEERREFLRAIDTVKKRVQRCRKWVPYLQDAVADPRTADDRHRSDERDAVWQAAAQVLSNRQQNILRLSTEGWSVQEIAERLDTSPERVSDEKYKAIRKLRAQLGVEKNPAAVG
jgi:RNA polymerase sigma factor (sigma-70 family)